MLTANTGGSTTWDIKLDPNKTQASPTSNTGDFYVVITFGKTAREAMSSDTNTEYKGWDIYVRVTIGSGTLAAT